jgi:hypothetical protein
VIELHIFVFKLNTYETTDFLPSFAQMQCITLYTVSCTQFTK